MAAVHAGALGYGETRVVQITILTGGESYPGSTRHEVTTDSCGPWHGSCTVAPTPGAVLQTGAGSRRAGRHRGVIIPAFIIPGALWLLFSATSRWRGVLFRAYFNACMGVLAAATTVLLLPGLFSLVMFITCSSEFGLFQPKDIAPQ